MNFTRISKWCMESDCGRYTVTRSGQSGEYQYLAFHATSVIGGPYANSADAKDSCIDHRAKKGAV